jgi:Fuc2NAc and GlcNAc transferase
VVHAMRIDVIVVDAAALALSAALTGVVLRLALRHGLLDLPNERSSHIAPTPRGGGLAIVIASAIALSFLSALGAVERNLVVALLGGGIAVAVVGFIDDRHRLSATVRLLVHAAAAAFALFVLGGLPPIQVGESVLHFGWAGSVIATLGVIWVLNLFNFMDGIDGIAASEAVFIVCSGALLVLVHGQYTQTVAVGLAFGAAALGFLLWNWPPAKIFMGDVGSGYLGYVISVMAIAAARDMPAAVWIWLILGGVFFVDATVTLVRRAIRRERLYEAHRSHAYQRLARRWGSHERVTLAVMLVNLAWLLPCALMAALHPGAAIWISVGALAPLLLAAVVAGAGRRDSDP